MTILERDRIRYCRAKLKELVPAQRARKAVLRQPHVADTWRVQHDTLEGAALLTTWHCMLNHLRGREASHLTPYWKAGTLWMDAQKELNEKVPAPAVA